MTVVFVQAPADLIYALGVCERAVKPLTSVILVIVNVRSVYDYVVTLNLPVARVAFVPYILEPLPFSPWGLWKARKTLIRQYDDLFGGLRIECVYFFCALSDAVTPYFLVRLAMDSPVFLVDHYNIPEIERPGWTAVKAVRAIIKRLLLRAVTGVSFQVLSDGDTTFIPADYGIKNGRISPSVSYLAIPAGLEAQILILDSNDHYDLDTADYARQLSTVLNELARQGKSVCLKEHPRAGHSSFLDAFNLRMLPSGCPLELFDLRGFTAAVSISSTALATAAKQGCAAISLLYVIKFTNEATVRLYREYLDQQSENRILYPRSVAEAIEMIGSRAQ